MARDRVQADYVAFPPGPADAEALGRVHVAARRQTYPGLLPPAYLARMSPERHARRFALSLSNAQASNVTLAPAGNMSTRRFYERLDGVAEPERREPGPGGGRRLRSRLSLAGHRQPYGRLSRIRSER